MEAQCNFCGSLKGDLQFFVSEDAYICEKCVDMCHNVVEKRRNKELKKSFQLGLLKPKDIFAILNEHVISQEEAKMALSVALYSHYKRVEKPVHKGVELVKSNILLLGPTGSGKTLLAETLAKIMNVPFAIADATALTEAGYVGEDVESILSRLISACDGDLEKAEKGIIYIDEFDKIARKGESSSSGRDISGEGVQQGLLKILEGASVYVPLKGSRKNSDSETVLFDTKHILFIAGGAFVGMHEARHNTKVGFFEEKEQEAPKEIEPKELIRFGLIPEIVGRIPVIVELEVLCEKDLISILQEPKNSLVKQYKALFELDGIELVFQGEALEVIAHQAFEKEVGARGLRSIIDTLLRPLLFELPSNEHAHRCIITKEFVLGNESYILE